ncbi:MAG: hypothetical protein AVDCRST_MAG65-1507, partial [uncultured Solirubrobacteraceae bacterium]
GRFQGPRISNDVLCRFAGHACSLHGSRPQVRL